MDERLTPDMLRAATLLGGVGTFFGPVFGAGVVIALQKLLAEKVGAWVTVIIGAIFRGLCAGLPQGCRGGTAAVARPAQPLVSAVVQNAGQTCSAGTACWCNAASMIRYRIALRFTKAPCRVPVPVDQIAARGRSLPGLATSSGNQPICKHTLKLSLVIAPSSRRSWEAS